MTGNGQKRDLLRHLEAHEHGRVTFVELFSDLVFVFAITQLSHSLLGHLSILGAIQTGMLFMAVWWVWIYTSWIANWLDPDRTPVRLLLLVLMLAGLVMSAAIPSAFDTLGLAYAGAHVFIQIGRTGFVLWAVRDHEALARNFQRILVWLIVSGVFWIAGGFAEGGARLAFWLVALAIEYAGPSCGFAVPGLGRSMTADWNISGGHLAERCALFIIIALGESILVTGATFAGLDSTPATIWSFVVAFIGSVAMWWIYFDTGHERGSHSIAQSGDPGRLGRLAYTYLHLPIVAGIVVAAVSDELILAHPFGHMELATAMVVLGGPTLYLLGVALFKRTFAPHFPLSHLVGLVPLAILAPFSFVFHPVNLAAAAAAILILVAVWEMVSLKSIRAAHKPP